MTPGKSPSLNLSTKARSHQSYKKIPDQGSVDQFKFHEKSNKGQKSKKDNALLLQNSKQKPLSFGSRRGRPQLNSDGVEYDREVSPWTTGQLKKQSANGKEGVRSPFLTNARSAKKLEKSEKSEEIQQPQGHLGGGSQVLDQRFIDLESVGAFSKDDKTLSLDSSDEFNPPSKLTSTSGTEPSKVKPESVRSKESSEIYDEAARAMANLGRAMGKTRTKKKHFYSASWSVTDIAAVEASKSKNKSAIKSENIKGMPAPQLLAKLSSEKLGLQEAMGMSIRESTDAFGTNKGVVREKVKMIRDILAELADKKYMGFDFATLDANAGPELKKIGAFVGIELQL